MNSASNRNGVGGPAHPPDPSLTTDDVLQTLSASGQPLTEWGLAMDDTPMLSVRIGGQKQPPIFVTAGSHATETAGVHGALNLLQLLDTEHEVHILPLRDPVGFAGVNHCLSMAAGEPVFVTNHAAVLDYLTAHGSFVREQGETRLFMVGDVGFAWHPLRPGLEAFWRMLSGIRRLAREAPASVETLWGKSVLLVNPASDVEGSGEMQRCWHGVMSAKGEWLHFNRFFGRSDAPREIAAVDRLMRTVRPGLTCDLHEGNGDGFWLPIPRPEDDERAFALAKAFFEYIHSRGYPITTYERWLATDHTDAPTPDWMQPEPRLPGLFWINTPLRDEGPNLMDYAGSFGLAFGTEGPMVQPLQMRVDGITHGTLAAIRVWENTLS